MLKVVLTKPGLIYSEKERKNWIIYHQHLMLCSYMLHVCVRIINPRYGCTLINSVFNHLLVHLSHLAACQNVSLRHASAAKLIKYAHLPAVAMPKIVVTLHHELSSIIMDQIVLVTFISQYYSNNLVHQVTPSYT